MYTVKTLPEFDKWLDRIKDRITRLRLSRRLDKAQRGNLGDVKPVGQGLFEMREHFGPGWRMYYTKRGDMLIIMLGGGDKGSQEKDIATAKEREATLVALMDVWIAAREYEKAIAVIDKIADFADPAFYYMRAAQLYVQSGSFEGAAESAEKALDAGIDDRVNALVVAGSAYTELGEWDKAIGAFQRVAEIGDDNEQDNARNWIRFAEESRQLTLSSLP